MLSMHSAYPRKEGAFGAQSAGLANGNNLHFFSFLCMHVLYSVILSWFMDCHCIDKEETGRRTRCGGVAGANTCFMLG